MSAGIDIVNKNLNFNLFMTFKNSVIMIIFNSILFRAILFLPYLLGINVVSTIKVSINLLLRYFLFKTSKSFQKYSC